MKKCLSLLLAFVLTLSLAAPAGAAETPQRAATEVQIISDPVHNYYGLGFLQDSYGFATQHTDHRPMSVFGEPLTEWGGTYQVLTEDVFGMGLKDYAILALFNKSGRRLTDYKYLEFEVFDDYIRAKKGEVSYDFFTLDGTPLPKPVIPEGYVVGQYLSDNLVVAGDPNLRPFGYPGHSWALFTMDGTRITPADKLYYGIERLTDELLLIYENGRHRGIINEQGELIHPISDSYGLYVLDSGEFITSTMISTPDPTISAGREFVCYNAKGERLWSCIAEKGDVFFGRYMALEELATGNILLMDRNGPVTLPENTRGLAAEGFSIGNVSLDVLVEHQIPSPGFFTYGADKLCTFFDIDGNVVIPARTCKYIKIGCNRVLFVNEEENTELYTIDGEKLATLPGRDYQILASGLISHYKNGAYALYNLQGKQITDYTYARCSYSGAATGLANVERNGKWFLINAEGEEQNKIGFDQPVVFSGHFATYQVAGNWGIVRYLEPGDGLFWDVKEGDWFRDAVDYCYENDILNGTGVGRFQPEGVTTRAMVVTVLYRLAGSPAVEGKLPFTDTKAGQWYSDAVLWASQNDIVKGVGDNRFAPTDNITREQIATILHRYSKFTGIEMAEGADLSTFPDSGNVGGYANDAMAWAVAEELITGTISGGVTSLSPKATATRAQLATIISRYQQMFPADSE